MYLQNNYEFQSSLIIIGFIKAHSFLDREEYSMSLLTKGGGGSFFA